MCAGLELPACTLYDVTLHVCACQNSWKAISTVVETGVNEWKQLRPLQQEMLEQASRDGVFNQLVIRCLREDAVAFSAVILALTIHLRSSNVAILICVL